MKLTRWGNVSQLFYGKALRNCPIESDENYRFRVFGTNGPIGWTTEPLYSGPGIIIGRKGAYRGVHFSSEPFFVIDTAYYFQLTSPELNLRWAYYKLLTVDINRMDVGAAIPTTNRDQFYALPIHYPPRPLQERVVSILSAYDDLIDINRRRIQLLEESARLLFREWFVYFRFPPRLSSGQAGHEKAFPVEYRNSTGVKIVDGVPEGWEKEKLNKLITFKRGVEPGSDNYLETYESGSFLFFRVSDLITRNPSIFVDEQYAKSALLKKSDIVISLDGSVGIVSMGIEGCYSTGIRKLIIKDKKINRPFLYFLMKSHYVQGVINAYAKGTTIQHAGEAIKHMNPILPPQNLMDLFDEITNPVLNEILILLEQNQKLAQARDLLLPRLMSGAIDPVRYEKLSNGVEV
jgi:type I restriction enzyme S subunit